MWNEKQLCYLAGFVDGEGSIYIYKRKTPAGRINYDIRFQISNTHEEVINWIQHNFGGTIWGKKRSNGPKHWKCQYIWNANRELFDKIIPAIYPYIIVKKAQIELALEFRKTYSRNNRHHGDMNVINETREEFLHKMRSLNKRGL